MPADDVKLRLCAATKADIHDELCSIASSLAWLATYNVHKREMGVIAGRVQRLADRLGKQVERERKRR